MKRDTKRMLNHIYEAAKENEDWLLCSIISATISAINTGKTKELSEHIVPFIKNQLNEKSG